MTPFRGVSLPRIQPSHCGRREGGNKIFPDRIIVINTGREAASKETPLLIGITPQGMRRTGNTRYPGDVPLRIMTSGRSEESVTIQEPSTP